jgi:coenzyme F420-reducing hydrogenase delta subunit
MPGDCHYLEGNANARRRIEHIRLLLKQIGLEPERARMFNLSSAMGGQFAAAATEMTEQVAIIGPNPLRKRRISAEQAGSD